jgi:hypothetical protein
MNWGDVPAWIGTITTSVSVLIAALAYRKSILDKERGQASKVAAWVALFGEPGKEHRIVRLSNSSDAPVYELIVSSAKMPELHI